MADPSSMDDRVWSSANFDMHMFSRRFQRGQGAYEKLDELWIFLCVEGGGRLVRKSAGQDVDGLFLPGIVGVGSPEDGGEGLWPDVTLIGIGVEPSKLAMLLRELAPREFDVAAIASTFHRNALLTDVIREMWAQAGLHGHSAAFLDHGAAVAIHQLARSLDLIRVSKADRPLSPSELKVITEFVDANIAEDISVERLARIVSLGANHFSRRFRATTGLAPYQFLTQRRLDRATELLTSSQFSVTEIGLTTGYANPSHFSAAFRRYKGMTPLAWRRAR